MDAVIKIKTISRNLRSGEVEINRDYVTKLGWAKDFGDEPEVNPDARCIVEASPDFSKAVVFDLSSAADQKTIKEVLEWEYLLAPEGRIEESEMRTIGLEIVILDYEAVPREDTRTNHARDQRVHSAIQLSPIRGLVQALKYYAEKDYDSRIAQQALKVFHRH